eukprot:2889232-Amphidinium_carterae.1
MFDWLAIKSGGMSNRSNNSQEYSSEANKDHDIVTVKTEQTTAKPNLVRKNKTPKVKSIS